MKKIVALFLSLILNGQVFAADVPFTTYAYPATGTSANRTTPDRLAVVYDIKDFGAIGDGTSHKVSTRYATLGAAQAVWPCVTNISTDEIDWAATQTAITTMFASTNGGKVYVSPGSYQLGTNHLVLSSPGGTKGIFTGEGSGTSSFSGTYDAGFIVEAPYQVNTVTEVSGLSILNSSTNIGTGALRFTASNYPATIRNLTLGGMTCLDSGWNVFNNTITGIQCQGNGVSIAPYGSVGILLGGANLSGYRELASHEIGVSMVGSNSMTVSGISIEETPVGILMGQIIYFATATITGANGSKKLTVTGTLYPPAASTATPLQTADQIVTSGVNPTANPTILITGQDSGTPNEQGVYSLSGADGVTISTPQPITVRRRWLVAGFSLSNFETEGVGTAVYVLNANGGTISGINATGQINQGITNQYGGNVVNSGNTSSPMAGIYIEVAGVMSINSSLFSGSYTKAAVEFAPGGNASLNNLVFDGVFTNGNITGTSDSTAFIDNGAGATLNTTATSSTTSLQFTAGTIPAAVGAGTPIYSVTSPSHVPIYTRVATKNNGTGVVTLNQAVSGVTNGETIKFAVPSAVAGNVLTVQTITTTLGRNTTVFPPGLFTLGSNSGGYAIQGAGVGTGASTPMVSDQVNGYGPNNGGQSYAQYTLIKADGTAVSLNVGPEVFTFVGGKKWGTDNLTGVSGLNSITKVGLVANPNSNDIDNPLNITYAGLPGQAGVRPTAQQGMIYTITDAATGNCSDAACNWGANVTGGGGSLERQVRYNSTTSNWTVMGK